MISYFLIFHLLFNYTDVNTIDPEPKIVEFMDIGNVLVSPSDTLYILNFWATWCKPCVEELPYFERINSELNSDGVKVLLISLDFANHYTTRVYPFLARRKIQSEVWLFDDPDADNWIPKISKDWSGAIPFTVFVKNGVKFAHEGSLTYEQLLDIIQHEF